MQLYFSASNPGFYTDEFKKLPEDAVKISEKRHRELMDGQAEGKIIVPDKKGRPVLKTMEQLFPEKALADAKACQKELIIQWRDEALAAGVEYEGGIYQADANSYNMLSGVLAATAAGIPLPKGFVWRTIDNENITMATDSLRELGQAMLEHIQKCHHKAWSLKAAVDQATSIDAVQSITW